MRVGEIRENIARILDRDPVAIIVKASTGKGQVTHDKTLANGRGCEHFEERMGQYFHIVNPAKKQYISANSFEENNKASGVMRGFHANALALLVCKVDEVMNPPPQLAGSWFGDNVYAVGDDNGKADEYGILTSTLEDPERNLYFLADDEFEDISLKAIAMMCLWDAYWAEKFVERCTDGWPNMLLCLGNVVFTEGCEPLENALETHVGTNWIDLYKQEFLAKNNRSVEPRRKTR